MTPERRAVLTRFADGLPDLDRPLLVVVDGADGSGKTWFADDLAHLLRERGRSVVRASVDDFHHPREHRHALGRTGETVWARSFDYRALRRELLDPWCDGAGTAYRCRHHDLATDALLDEPTVPVPEHGVPVVDGVFVQRAELHDCWDWWCGSRCRTRSGYAGWPAATALPPIPTTPTSGATSRRRRSTVQRPTRSATPTSSSTTPTPARG